MDVTLRLNRGIPDVPWARHELLGVLEDAGVDIDLECVGLVVTELLTNALLHGREPVEVRARATQEQLRVEVHDSSELEPAPRDADPTDLSGRGLMLVAGLVDRWGVASSRTGKYVWAEFDGGAHGSVGTDASSSADQRSSTSHGTRMTPSIAVMPSWQLRTTSQ